MELGKTGAWILPTVLLGALGVLAWGGGGESGPVAGELSCVVPGLVADLSGGDIDMGPPTPVVEVAVQEAPADPEKAVVKDWWEGKEGLRLRLKRARYFDPVGADDASGESEEERLAKRREFVFEEFNGWLKRYRRETDPAERAVLVREGVVRATIRQRELRAMQVGDPGEMAKLEIPSSLREAMPEEVKKIVMGDPKP